MDSTVTVASYAIPGPQGSESGLVNLPPTCVRALRWLRSNENRDGGIKVHAAHVDSYPEVTGYLIPTLLDNGERDLARRCLEWLLRIQRADGSFTDPRGRSLPFDTGQVLRGLLAGRALVPQASAAAQRAAEYLCALVERNQGQGFGAQYNGRIAEGVHLYVLPALVQAAEALGRQEYLEAAQRCTEHYLSLSDTLSLATLTHFLAYQIEALIDSGRPDRAVRTLNELRDRQLPDGSVRAYEGVNWICSPGLAQLAICWYKLGQSGPADRALAWLEAHQLPSGGFLGSCGPGAEYFVDQEPAWAVKFYLDAHRLRLAATGRIRP